MDRLMAGRTTFVIAHRLSTVKNSDCILVLEQGRIIEQGSHEELSGRPGAYYQLYTGGKPVASLRGPFPPQRAAPLGKWCRPHTAALPGS